MLRPGKDEEHHLLRVLRARPGLEVRVFDGRGRECTARVRKASGSGDTSLLERVSEIRFVERSEPEIILFQCVPKGRRMDLVVEKATEMGASGILPVVSQRTAVRLPGGGGCKRRERWRRIAVSAAGQSGRAWVPEIGDFHSFSDAMKTAGSLDLFVFGSLGVKTPSLKTVLTEGLRGRVRRAGLLIGPEGDLTGAEAEEASAAGGRPASFGRLTMRVETASIFGLSCFLYESGERKRG
ncbi:MAG: RsmE family RNA methyltransferase [Kiritimatiellia bacterium]